MFVSIVQTIVFLLVCHIHSVFARRINENASVDSSWFEGTKLPRASSSLHAISQFLLGLNSGVSPAARASGHVHSSTKLSQRPDANQARMVSTMRPGAYWNTQQSQSRSDATRELKRVELTRRALGEKNPHTLKALKSYAETLKDVGRQEEAEPLLKDVLEATRWIFGADHPDTLKALDEYSDALRKLDRHEEIETLESEFVKTSAKAFDSEHPEFLSSLKRYVSTLGELGSQAETVIKDVSWSEDVPLDPELYHQVKADAYSQCAMITESCSKSFSLATKLMTEEQRKAVWAIYAWCRRTDDIVDSPRAMENKELMMSDLSAWRSRLLKIWEGEAEDLIDVALVDAKEQYPTLELEPFLDMIEGMVMDTPQLGKDRYNTWDELYLYCYRVASTVGLMTLPIMGTAPGHTEEQAKEPAIALGIALQITNILRDVGEDARRGRIYLPLEDLNRFGVTEKQILEGRLDTNYVNLMKFEIQRARDYYKQAQAGIPMLSESSRLGVQAASDVYGGILEKLEQNGYDNFKKRAFVTRFEKFATLLSSWWTVNQMR